MLPAPCTVRRSRFTAQVEAVKLLAWSSLAALLLCLAGACSGPTPTATVGHGVADLKPIPLGAGEKLKVVATTNIIGDVVRRIGGDWIELTTLMGIGVEVHTYVPKPSDMAAVYDAHVLFANGGGLEEGLQKMLAGVGGNAAQIQLADGLELRSASPELGKHGPASGLLNSPDPHVWFDVQNVIHWAKTIEEAFCTLDPAHAEAYTANAEATIHELNDLDDWVMTQVATIPQANRKLVTDHPVFGYLGRYGLEQVGAVYPLGPSSEPSAWDIAALENAIRQYGVPAIFTESTVSPKLAEQVAQDTGVKVISLYTESLGGPGSGAESYVDLMRFDVQAIVEALRGY
jgi:manganese/iron transport system substrate-binding protein